MMNGVVNPALEAILQLNVQDAQDQAHAIDATVDTGFNGFLTLPLQLIATLGLPWLCRQQGQLADGTIQVFDVYTATVVWDGTPRGIEIEAVVNKPLIGMSLLQGYELRVQVVPGGAVSVAAIP